MELIAFAMAGTAFALVVQLMEKNKKLEKRVQELESKSK